MISNLIDKVRGRIRQKTLMRAVIESKADDNTMSTELAVILISMVKRRANSYRFKSFTYNEDMQAFAMTSLCKNWYKFNPEKSDNPYAYYTQCIMGSFANFLNSEKRQQNIKEELKNMVDDEQHF